MTAMESVKHLAVAAALLVSAAASGCSKTSVHEVPGQDDGGELAGYKGEYVVPVRLQWDGRKLADITYQILVYSFADTDADNDNIGDLRGMTAKLDYIDRLGASAVWLSPIHPCEAYHGYGVNDYFSVNPDFGTEEDLRNFINAAHAMDIDVYLDYVLNHCSSSNPWFEDACSGEDSPYRDWFAFSYNPKEDIAAGKIAQIATEGAAGYDADEWRHLDGNTGYKGVLRFHLDFSNPDRPCITVSEAAGSDIDDENAVAGPNDKYIHFDSKSARKRMYDRGNGIYELTCAFDSDWGFLITSSETGWADKYGAEDGDVCIEFGVPFPLAARTSSFDPHDVWFRMPMMWHAVFKTDRYADFNYGPVGTAEESPAFQELLRSASHWIELGIDGFRLDAVKHIYRNQTNYENPVFLGKWYEATDNLYRSAGNGRNDRLYTVGEVLTSNVDNVAPYYEGLPALFEFAFWTRLAEGINSGTGYRFVDDLLGYRRKYAGYREDFIVPTKLSNHDEERAGSRLGRSMAKMKLAAAVLLTAGGDPYIYQGEELGYWGVQDNGDEYVRTPIMWDEAGLDVAREALGGKIDNAMLQSGISVEAQEKDPDSLLNLYRTFARLRNTCPALADGLMERHPVYNGDNEGFRQICAYYMVSEDQKMLVVHNFSDSPASIKPDDRLDTPVGLSGNAKVAVSGARYTLTLGGYGSVVFLL